VLGESDGRPDQQHPEHQEGGGEDADRGGAHGDEDGPHDQRERDAEQQHLLAVLVGNRERLHDDQEDEEVVDREALLDHPAGEVLGRLSEPAPNPTTTPNATATPM
jgi:hypothetical protein